MAAKKASGPRARKSNVIKIAEFQEDQPRQHPQAERAAAQDDAPDNAPETSATPVAADAAPQPGDNWNAVAEARKAAIKEAHEETYDLEKQEEALMALHIQPLRDRRSEIKSNLKSLFEIGAKQFNAWHGVYFFDREAETGADYITMQIIREQAAVCPVGGTMDLVEIAEKATKQREELAKAEAAKKTKVENVEHTL